MGWEVGRRTSTRRGARDSWANEAPLRVLEVLWAVVGRLEALRAVVGRLLAAVVSWLRSQQR